MNTPECSAEFEDIRTRCYRCGAPACGGCSALVTSRGRRVRLCADCLESEREELALPPEVISRLGLTPLTEGGRP